MLCPLESLLVLDLLSEVISRSKFAYLSHFYFKIHPLDLIFGYSIVTNMVTHRVIIPGNQFQNKQVILFTYCRTHQGTHIIHHACEF